MFSTLSFQTGRDPQRRILDNPYAPTLLYSMHMTWFRGLDNAGKVTLSNTHPVNQAIYNWNAPDIHARQPWGHPDADASLKSLKEHFALERLSWTPQQCRDLEKREHTIRELAYQAHRPAATASTKQNTPRRGI